jgi:hypothetical protein
MEEITQLKRQIQELQKKVDDLYSTAGFPEEVMRALVKKGFFRVRETLVTTFPTVDDYEITNLYHFGRVNEREEVLGTVGTSSFTVIESLDPSTNTFTARNHGYGNDNPVTFRTTGTPPDGILNGSNYTIMNTTADTFQLRSVSSGSLAPFTDRGNGRHFLQKVIQTF